MSLQGRRVLVTGGAGFIGSHLVEDLVRRGAQVTVYDDFSSGHMENLAAVRRDIRIVRGDILDYRRLRRAMAGVTLVSHQAAQLEILRCLDDPAADLRVNTLGTLNVLRAAVECGVTKVINASSACVYGQAQSLPEAETHPTQPNWPYGVSKLAAEHYARITQTYQGMAVTHLRYGIVYGPREWYGRVLTIFIRRALAGQPLIVFGDGQQVRDFIAVEDVVAAHARCAELEAANGQTYNIGTGQGTTVAQLAELVARCAGRPLEIRRQDLQEGTAPPEMPDRPRLPLELKAMVLDSRKARAELGWQPAAVLAEGVAAEMAWARAHPRRWQTVHI